MSNWIKLRTGLINHPKVVRMAFTLFPMEQHRLSVVIGGLVQVWSMADMHADGEKLPGMSLETLDLLVGISGFAQAMVEVGWLEEGEKSLNLPNYQEHNGSTAKRRAVDQKQRKLVRKMSADYPQDVGKVSASCRQSVGKESDTITTDVGILSAKCRQSVGSESDKIRSRERERVREEENTENTKDTPPPLKAVREKFSPESADLPFGSEDFVRSWASWCRHRSEIKKPLTPQATTEQLAKLRDMGESRAIAAIRHSVAGGWQGIFEPDGFRGGGSFAKPTALEKARESADLVAAGKSSIANTIFARLQQIDAETEARNGVA